MVDSEQYRQNGTNLGKRTHQQDEEHGNNNTQALSMICLLPVKEDWQTTKEEGSKEEDRQEGAGARNVENEYVNLEKCRQNKTTTTKQWHTLNDAEIISSNQKKKNII